MTIDKNAKCEYIVDSNILNFSFSFLVESSVVMGKINPNNGLTIVIKMFSNDNMFVKYHEDSAHNLFTTNC
jgi:hypothetical protein